MSLPNTLAAVRAYDLFEVEYVAGLAAARTNAEVNGWLERERAEAAKVSEAFALDTSGVNTRANALLMKPGDRQLRKWLFDEHGYAEYPDQAFCRSCGERHARGLEVKRCWHCGASIERSEVDL